MLTPSHDAEQGATISALHDVSSSSSEWNITANTQIGWHLLLNLDDSWGFDTTTSAITISVNGHSSAAEYDLLFSFSMDNAKYLSIFLSMDNTQNNVISPSCDTSSNPSTSMWSGNVNATVNINNGQDRWYKSSNGHVQSEMEPQQYGTGYNNTFPVEFTLINTEYLIISYSTPSWSTFAQSCGFNAFDADSGVQVYIGAGDNGQFLSVTSITVEKYILDNIPTLTPTLKPTLVPTLDPTLKPTLVPTLDPTFKPTLDPTFNPTLVPTLKPTLPPLITCGEQLTGDYNDEILSFDVRLPYNGHVTFDASQSNFVVKSLTVVFGATPIAADTDYDGVLAISNQIAADYTFSIQASHGVYGTFHVTVSCESNNPTLLPTDDPTHSNSPETITCGDHVSGSYKNAAVVFQVNIPYRGDLEFDASNSNPLVITSLTALFGITPIAFDTNYDGIITLTDTVSGTYTFTIIAEDKASQMYEVHISCYTFTDTDSHTVSPTAIESTHIIDSPNIISSTSYIKNKENDDNSIIQKLQSIFVGMTLYIAVAVAFTVLCITLSVVVFCCKWCCSRKPMFISVHDHDRVPSSVSPEMVAMSTIASSMVSDVNDPLPYNALLLYKWLETKVFLPQYFNIFLDNGYDSFEAVKRIRFRQELKDMGITKQGHISLIMNEIRTLQKSERGRSSDKIANIPRALPISIRKKKNRLFKKQSLMNTMSLGTGSIESMYKPGENVGTGGSTPPTLDKQMGNCTDCSQYKEGKIYENDGHFYCNVCWKCYQ